MDIVHVVWKDTGVLEGWTDISLVCYAFDDIGNRTHDTIGFLLFDNEDWIAIANGWNGTNGSAYQTLIIPQSSIIEMEVRGHAEVIPDFGDEEQEGAGGEGPSPA